MRFFIAKILLWMKLRSKEDVKRTFSPLTPALSPLRGEGEAQAGSWSQCALNPARRLSMNRARFVVPPLGGRGASDRLKPALRAKTVSWSQCALKMASGLSMNLRSKEDAKRTFSPLTPGLSPLRGEGEERNGSCSECAIF